MAHFWDAIEFTWTGTLMPFLFMASVFAGVLAGIDWTDERKRIRPMIATAVACGALAVATMFGSIVFAMASVETSRPALAQETPDG